MRGRANFEDVCSVCGSEESAHAPFVEKSELVTGGKMAHSLCKTCFEDGQKPVLFGSIDQQKKKAEEHTLGFLDVKG